MDRRSRSWRLLAQVPPALPPLAPGKDRADLPASEVIDGVTFTYTPGTRCFVCTAEDGVRILVDQLLVRAWSYRQILRAIEPLQEEVLAERRIGYHSIRRHAINHVPVDELAIRQVMERRAQEEGLSIVVGEGPIVTNAGVVELVRNRGFEAILEGRAAPTIRETIDAARLLDELDRRHGDTTLMRELETQVNLLLEVVREVIPEAAWETLVRTFEARLAERGVAKGVTPDGTS